MITCAKCGAMNHDDTVKCAACGTYYAPPAPPVTPAPPVYTTPPTPTIYTTPTPPIYSVPPVYNPYGPIINPPGYGFAVASLILGILACLSLGWGLLHSILAIVFGGISKSRGYYGSMATTGIVLGIISVVFFTISLFAFYIPFYL